MDYKAGLSLVDVAEKSFPLLTSTSQPRASYHLGVYVNQPLSQKTAVQTELLYVDKGFRSKGNGSVGDAKVHFHYLNIPVLVSYQPMSRLFLEIGPELGLLLKQNLLVDRSVDLGAAAGIRYNLTPVINVNIRYNHGLTNLSQTEFSDSNGSTIGTSRMQNRSLYVSLGYTLKGAK